MESQLEILSRHATVTPTSEFADRLATGKPLRAKLGVDPTAPHVHLGWAVVLRKLRQFQDLGHQAVLIIGDFTGRIGDPSGQNKTRPMLSGEEVRAFASRLVDQFGRILNLSTLEVRYNSEWLDALGVEGILKLASQTTVARMLERDDFAKRYAAHQPITVTEFLYPLMQGYDSVAVEADVELGGTDQLFNLHMGRTLQPGAGQKPQVLLTLPLLVGTDGHEKMSQSKGNYIGIDESPTEMFGKLMRIPDELMPDYLRLAAWWPEPRVEKAVASERPEQLKRTLAADVVALYHGEAAGIQAREEFDSLFKEHKLPDEIRAVPIPESSVSGDTVNLPVLIREIGFASSSAESRRLIGQGGVKIDGRATDQDTWASADLKGKIIQVGKRKFARLT